MNNQILQPYNFDTLQFANLRFSDFPLKIVRNCTNNKVIADYIYDHNGKRIAKKEYTNGALKRIVYSLEDGFEKVKLASNSAVENTTYYMANGKVEAKNNPDGSRTYYYGDHLGSNAMLTNQSGTVVEKTSYEPFGEVKSGGTKSKFQYTGQEKDAETGLNYYDSKYYDSHIQRFIQADPIVQDVYDPQMLNRYSYVRNNPLKYTDPSGNVPILAVGIVGGVIGAGAGYAEVRLSNPNATFADYAKGIGVGFAAGAGASVAGAVIATPATATLASTVVSTGVTTVVSNVLGGATAGMVGNGINNKFNTKNFLHNAPQMIVFGGVTGGASGMIARNLVSAGPGPAPKLSITGANAGPNTFRYMERFTIDTGINNLLFIPINVNNNKKNNNEISNKKQKNGLVNRIFSFFKRK